MPRSSASGTTKPLGTDCPKLWSINTAISVASNGDVIQLASEIYQEGSPLDAIGKAITIQGVVDDEGQPLTVLDGMGQHRLVTCENNEGPGTRFLRLKMINGRFNNPQGEGDRGGGAIYAKASSPFFEHCVIESCSSQLGGGVQVSHGGSPEFLGCIFRGCSGDWLGGAVRVSTGFARFVQCRFEANHSNGGGAVFVRANYASVEILDSTFEENWSSCGCSGYGGGAVFFDGNQGGGLIRGCQFLGNTAQYGSAIRSNNAIRPTIESSFFCEGSSAPIYGQWIDGGENEFAESCRPPCPADLNGNDEVDAGDLGILIGFWGTSGGESGSADLNNNGVVEAADLGLLMSFWGPCP